MEPIAYSLRFAAASGNGSCLALDINEVNNELDLYVKNHF
jgi:hypothetical protein